MKGFGGADIFLFDTALGGTNVDRIADFTVGVDAIDLSQTIFTGLGAGTLSASAFVIGAAATNGDQHILYNSSTGGLFFDVDGDGAGVARRFAALAPSLALTNTDFIVV